jgi:RHS repeat-associated protein
MAGIRKLLVGLALLGMTGGAYAASATRTSSFEYDGTGLLTKEVVEPGNPLLCLVNAYDHDFFGNQISVETRNCDGSLGTAGEAAAPPLGSDAEIPWRQSFTNYDAQARFPASVENALGQTETRAYDTRFGAMTSLTGPNGLTTTWTYDVLGRKTLETRSDGNKTQLDYLYCSGVNGGTAICPANGQYVLVTTPKNAAGTVNGAISKSYRDALNREIRSETEGFNGTLVFKDTQYDSFGRVSQTSKPYYNGAAPEWTTFTYDALSRLLTETSPAATAGSIRTANTYNGLTTTATLSNNGTGTNMPGGVTQTKTAVKNSQGQTVTVTDAQNQTITYTYDPFGNVLTTNAGGVVTTMTYDIRGRKITMADKDMGNWAYAYDVLGQLRRQTNAKGQVSTLAYDELNRMVTRTEPDLVSDYGFDWCTNGVGKLCDVTSDNGYVRVLSYDAQGRIIEVHTEIDSVANPYIVGYAYDANGRLSQTTYPENTVFPADVIVKNVYNARGYLSQVTNVAGTLAYWTANTVSATGKILTETLGNGATTTRAYDALERMTGNVVAKTGVNLQNFTYTYDTIGNLAQRVDVVQANLTENFAYDSLNRVLQSSGVGLTTKSFSYNAIGNIVTKSDVGTYNYPLPTAARPHAVSSITGTVNGFVNPSFTYDADGNMLTGLGRTLTYTSFDMPLTVAGVRFAGGASYNYTYTYNADHERTRLVHSTLGTFIYVHPAGRGELLYEKEVKPTGVVEHKNYINAGGLLIGVIIKRSDGTGDTNYFHQDRLGSLTLITNSTGGVLERLAYDAFGKRRNPNGTDSTNNSLFGINTDRGFTGHEHLDEVALIHMNGRIYDPVTARFLTPDPNVQSPTQLQSYNRYSYGLNNPLAGMDPTGYGFLSDLFSDPIGTIVHTVEKVVNSALDNPIKTIATIAVAYFTGIYVGDILGAGSLIGSAAGGFAGGLVGSGGDFKAALIGGVTAGAFNWAGGAFADSPLQLIAAHATIGCASAVASGGSCGAGALSAGFSKVATLGLNDYTTWDALSKGIAVTVIGGTASVLGGGKFENGAVTAAYGYLFNQLAHQRYEEKLANRGILRGPHEYETESACLSSVCPLDRTMEELRRNPAIGTRIGNTTDILVLGEVRHISDSSSTLNITVTGSHWLAPGAVSRTVFGSGEYTVIRTYGTGAGILPWLNEKLAPVGWKMQDQIIFDRARLPRTP